MSVFTHLVLAMSRHISTASRRSACPNLIKAGNKERRNIIPRSSTKAEDRAKVKEVLADCRNS